MAIPSSRAMDGESFRRHTIHTTPNTVTSANNAGGPQAATKPQKLSRPTWPIRMFCGLPMTVVAEPALAALASAIR